MSFATWSIRSPIPAILLFFLLTVAGIASFRALRVKNMPDFETNQFQVALSLPGASPSQLEIEVARPAEDVLATLRGVKFIRTTISEGVVLIRVDFEFDTIPADDLADTKDAIERIRSSLPSNLEDPSVRLITQADRTPTVTYAVMSPNLEPEALSWFVQDTVSRRILSLPGVYRVETLGAVAREIHVDVDPVRLTAVGLTAPDVSHALRRMQKDASGGQGRIGGAEQGIRVIGTVNDADELAALPITLPNGSHVRLNEIATVHDGMAERTTAARFDGRPAVGFQVLHTPGTNELELCAAVARAVAELQAEHPTVEFEITKTLAEEVENEYINSMRMLLEGAALAVLVVWIFLRNWRATLIGAIALPLSILPTFAVMYVAGFTLNTITLLALAVVVGILVDDAIVEIENIAAHVRGGLPVQRATEKAVTEIGRAVVATTLALIVVFLPMSFMKGFSGLVFRQFGWTAVAAVFASLLVARLITPLLAVRFLRPGEHPTTADGLGKRLYLRSVKWCLNHRLMTLGATVIFVVGSIVLWPQLPTGFSPAEDGRYTSINIELPSGATLDQTLAIVEEARRTIAAGPKPVAGVEHVFALIGQPPAKRNGVTGGAAQVHSATLTVALAPWGQRPRATEVEDRIRERLVEIPGARFSVNGTGFGTRVSIILSGPSPAALTSAARALEAQMATVPGLAGVTTTASLGHSDIVIRPDTIRAAELGVTTDAIAETARIATSGDFSPDLAKLNIDTRQVDIRVRLAETTREDLDTIAQLRVPGRNGLIPLSAIATVSLESGPDTIERYNRNRHLVITADLGGMPLGEALSRIAKLPVMTSLPQNVEWVRGGEVELMDELFAGFARVLVLAALCIYCLLVLLFKDFLHPLTILSAAPLSAGGALLGVWLSHSEIGLSVLIGFVMLLGIATKNSILLVDYAVVAMREHVPDEIEAIIEACGRRVRPIIMTSVAMTAGMLPLVLGAGSGDMSLSQPMAAAIIGGLATSTALTLIVVPVVFVYVVRFQRWVHRPKLSAYAP
jgi:hydrophobe/amphiphile efflux-1 (HAE1) family protein